MSVMAFLAAGSCRSLDGSKQGDHCPDVSFQAFLSQFHIGAVHQSVSEFFDLRNHKIMHCDFTDINAM